jgi:hypothetical protein
LALCLLRQLVPTDMEASLAMLGLMVPAHAALLRGRFPSVPVELLGAAAGGLGLCALALRSPELWLQVGSSASLVTWGALAFGVLTRRAAGMTLGLGLLAPLTLGLAFACVSPSGRMLLLGSLGDWSLGLVALHRLAQWLALSLAVLGSVTPLASAAVPRLRWLNALALAASLAVLLPRVVWVASLLTVPTDMLIWSELPLLLNLWKMRKGAIFYGPFSGLISYSYSPALEHVQYWLLRPLGLELSLWAHRALGVLWQLLAALWLSMGLSRYWGRGVLHAVLAVACLACLFSSLLAPHLHPDHLLMLSLAGAFWLVMREGEAEPSSRFRLALLVLLPVLATAVKLTGAGIGLGLVMVYLWQRDFRRVGLLAVSSVLACSTIWLFDATLGAFSDYAIRLQASQPLDWDRASRVWTTPPVLLCLVATAVVIGRARAPQAGPALGAARRVLLLTAGVGITSLAAYAKHGGRDNSLLPFALGGLLALALTLADLRSDSPNQGTTSSLYQLLGASLALLMPLAFPLFGKARAEALDAHQAAVRWLSDGKRQHERFFVASTAAYLDAGCRDLPDASLATIAELDLADRSEVGVFEQRVRTGHYDWLLVSASTLRMVPLFQRLLPDLQQGYRVIGPPALAGAWPTGPRGYVIAERRPARDIR